MKIIRALILTTLILSLTILPVYGQTGDDSPWGEILNPDGSIRWDLLTDLGTTTEPADWMDITLPGGMLIDLDATFHRYLTPSGNILVLPSPATLFFMALNPEESGFIDAHSMLGDGAAILAQLLGPTLNADQLAQLVSMGYTNPAEFFQAVIDGQENIWSIINVTFFFELLQLSFDSSFLVNALLLYLNGLENCEEIPGGCPEIPELPPTTSHCPAPTITQDQPILSIQKVAPDNPLVVGQDPDRRGADIEATVTVPPVIFTWYEEIQDPPSCRYDQEGDGSGCPGPGDRYEDVTDANGDSIAWGAYMEGNRFWDVIDGDIRCIEHVEVLPDPVSSLQATAELSPESRYWILNDLAGKYYDAYIHQDSFDLLPGLAPVSAGCSSDGTCTAAALISSVPFADPGEFNLRMWVYTTGAIFNWNGMGIPITQPRVLYEEDTLEVFVTLVTLIPSGAP